MAVTKIKPVKSALKRALDYIQNPDKTDGKMLVSSFRCAYETAYEEFEFTLSKAMQKGNNLAHHLIQSFEPSEATPEQAHEIGKRLADEITKRRYEYVLTTHVDKGHTHNHLIFCAASFVDYKKYISNKKSYYEIRNFSDKLCKEYGLSVVKPGQDKGKSYAEYVADRDGSGSWKSKIKTAIDKLIPESKDIENLLKQLQEQGYEVKRGKYISVRAPGQERFTRTKTLGANYTEDAISKRIVGEYVADIHSVNLIIEVENNVKAQQNAGLARWQKIQNLKEAAKTVNFLTENNLLQYADLEAKAAEVGAAFDDAADSLKTAEKRLADMASLMKYIANYQQTRPIYDGIKTAKDKATYKRENQSAIILHEAAVKALKTHAGDGGKLPNPDALQTRYEQLTKKKNELRAEYGKLKRQARDYRVVKQNVDSILTPGTERTRSRDRHAEL